MARVNLAMEIPSDSLKFDKEKGKYHANVNVLGIAYRPDGTVGARFSDTVNLDLEKEEWKEFTKAPYHYQNQFDAAAGTYKLTVVLGRRRRYLWEIRVIRCRSTRTTASTSAWGEWR